MHQIEIDFEVWKALTARREHERHTYNDVLRSLLALDSVQEPAIDPDSPLGQISAIRDNMASTMTLFGPKNGFVSRDLFLPDGTKLRATYKGIQYYGKIENRQWLDENGRKQLSPSAAAKAITGNNVNGLRFWEAMRPTDSGWRRLDLIV